MESVDARLRKLNKTGGHVATDEAATKLLWLALRNITASKTVRTLHTKNQTLPVIVERTVIQKAIAYPTESALLVRSRDQRVQIVGSAAVNFKSPLTMRVRT